MSDFILQFDNVVAGYGRTTILHGLSFAVPKGAITTIVGPNGAGKSTIFRAVFKVASVRSGQIRLAGEDITGVSERGLLQRGLCFIPQGRNLFAGLSVRENLELGLAALPAREAADGRIERVMERFPMLADKAHTQASTLSGGQQKLLEIARGLLLEPRVILVDEPSIGLSPIAMQEVFALLGEVRDQGVSVLMIEQNARSALAISDAAVVVELGRTRRQSPARELLADPAFGHLLFGGALPAGHLATAANETS